MLIHGDCLKVLKQYPDNTFDVVCTDPPYGLVSAKGKGFMDQTWDHAVPGPEYWREILRVAKPGAHLTAFGGTRTHHRLVCAIEDAGWEIRDALIWLYGCLDQDTECLTQRGFVRYDALRETDRVYQYDPETEAFSWTETLEIIRAPWDGSLVVLTTEQAHQQHLTPDHRVHVFRDGPEVLLAANLIGAQDVWLPYIEGGFKRLVRLVDAKITPYQGTVWCVRVPTGAFVVRRSGRPFITGNSGFPKSVDVAKSIDKALGVERKVVGTKSVKGRANINNLMGQNENKRKGARGCGAYAVGIKQIDIEIPMTAPASSLAQSYDGYGTAMKPAHEPIVWSQKPFSSVPLRLVEDVQHSIGGLLCLHLLHASNAELFSTSNHHDSNVATSVSAQVIAAVLHGGRSGALLEATDTCSSLEMARTCWSIAESWNSILAGLYDQRNMFTTTTATELTTALKTLRCSISQTMPASIMQAVTQADGSRCRATTAEAHSTGDDRNRNDTRTVFAAALASLQQYRSSTSAKNAASRLQATTRSVDSALRRVLTDTTIDSAVRPDSSPIVLARKPLIGTVAQNVVEFGTGGLNIDGARVPTDDNLNGGAYTEGRKPRAMNPDGAEKRNVSDCGEYVQPSGRWPPNVLLSHTLDCTDDACSESCPCRELDRQAPKQGSLGDVNKRTKKPSVFHQQATENPVKQTLDAPGGASRFFPRFRYNGKASRKERAGSTHPTVKPLGVIEWLLRLTAPPGNPIVLDPFMGSGTTIIAANRLGLRVVGIDQEAEYVEQAKERIKSLCVSREVTKKGTGDE